VPPSLSLFTQLFFCTRHTQTTMSPHHNRMPPACSFIAHVFPPPQMSQPPQTLTRLPPAISRGFTLHCSRKLSTFNVTQDAPPFPFPPLFSPLLPL
jgi:hypothetical protein